MENLKKTAKEFGDTTSGECGLVSFSCRPLMAGLDRGQDGEGESNYHRSVRDGGVVLQGAALILVRPTHLRR